MLWYENIHARHGYQWVHPVHVVLMWVGEGSPGPLVTAEGVQLDSLSHWHFRDWYPAWTEKHSDLLIWLSDQHVWTKETD